MAEQENGIAKLRKRLTEKYGEPIGRGRHRTTFDTGRGFVVKLPHDGLAFFANYQEWTLFSTWEGRKKKRLARCRLVVIDEIPLLVMERLLRVRDACKWASAGSEISVEIEKLPKWARKVDSKQVGYDRKGKLKAFDYAGG